jgi:hypothetical protein
MSDSVLPAPYAPRRDVLLLVGAASWTLLVWGSRIGLAAADNSATWLSWARIAVSLGLGTALIIVAIRSRDGEHSQWAAVLMVAFAAWMVVVWAPSLVGVLAGDGSGSFKTVHAVLAIISLTMGTLVAGVARRETLFYPRDTSTQADANNTTR